MQSMFINTKELIHAQKQKNKTIHLPSQTILIGILTILLVKVIMQLKIKNL